MKNIAKSQDKQSRDYDLKYGTRSSLNVRSTVLKKTFLSFFLYKLKEQNGSKVSIAK